LLSTLHRQRADLAAMRGTLAALAESLPAELKRGWHATLQARIERAQEQASSPRLNPDERQGMEDLVAAQERLLRALDLEPKPPSLGVPGGGMR
jgi:hypothetical protein